MAVQSAFGVAGGARRITEGCRVVFIEGRPLVVAVVFADEVLVCDGIAERRFRHVLRVGEHHVPFDARELVRHGLGERDEGQVEEEDPVLCVIHDVDELTGVQPGIERVAYRAHP